MLQSLKSIKLAFILSRWLWERHQTCKWAKSQCIQRATRHVQPPLLIQGHFAEPKPKMSMMKNTIYIDKTPTPHVFDNHVQSLQQSLLPFCLNNIPTVNRWFILSYQSWYNHPILQLVDCSSQVPGVKRAHLYFIYPKHYIHVWPLYWLCSFTY